MQFEVEQKPKSLGVRFVVEARDKRGAAWKIINRLAENNHLCQFTIGKVSRRNVEILASFEDKSQSLIFWVDKIEAIET